jgi:uncharacterized protein YkwD
VERRWLALAVLGAALSVEAPSRADSSSWAAASASPRPMVVGTLDPLESAALAVCGQGDAGLRDTARVLLARKLRGLPLPEVDSIAAVQRSAGEPHPWPRAWAVSARTLDRDTALPRLAPWLDAHRPAGVRRCGVATGTSADGTRALVVVTVDALADLAPLPTRARAGQWLTIEARMRVASRGGSVLLLGPGGAPRVVPSWFDGTTLRARFAPDRPGEFTVQVVADVATGPRPVVEATVFADVEPTTQADEAPAAAPGEDVAAGAPDDERLAAMITAARAAVGLPALARDARLDAVARAHARKMAAAGELSHDAGDGDPFERERAAGLDPAQAGENVAHSATLAGAHRALWASPSHRANLLRQAFDHVGVAVVRDGRGDAWVVEAFAGRR